MCSPFTHLISSLLISSEKAIKASQLNIFPYGDRRSDDLAFKVDTVYAAGQKFGGERLGSETQKFKIKIQPPPQHTHTSPETRKNHF